jgi:hypothetical protein
VLAFQIVVRELKLYTYLISNKLNELISKMSFSLTVYLVFPRHEWYYHAVLPKDRSVVPSSLLIPSFALLLTGVVQMLVSRPCVPSLFSVTGTLSRVRSKCICC